MYAEADLNDVLIPKLIHDFTGHYNRFDIFSVSVNQQVRSALQVGGAESGAGEAQERENQSEKTNVISLVETETATRRGA